MIRQLHELRTISPGRSLLFPFAERLNVPCSQSGNLRKTVMHVAARSEIPIFLLAFTRFIEGHRAQPKKMNSNGIRSACHIRLVKEIIFFSSPLII
jgi:hypothetical protein